MEPVDPRTISCPWAKRHSSTWRLADMGRTELAMLEFAGGAPTEGDVECRGCIDGV
ncbi:hypothetical protein SNOG_04271 [Parastagonospora nodorum SN15]|uniref:Uncharacterized protein n=1 Tax=Phaeosphaeria nodorum (strain SN15 / ATCC MYA-4574 / FGSC 10173) TaxID=321614 RepID=Q0UVE3_PHANO|nr:hypothetical protein SNOG_04271 [Parastagonospora nodorum SN15]EAT88031.1 hypothetical protein SNOG_04271 [Parastagonospora nodorum SN15]